MIEIWDAHCHRSRVGDHPVCVGNDSFSICGAIVNASQPADWPQLWLKPEAANDRTIHLAGLHPWFIAAAREMPWRDSLADLLDQGLGGIGEVGLDGGRAKRAAGFAEQVSVFQWQLQQAAARELPVSIHAVRANGVLVDALKDVRLPEMGIHLHDFHAPLAVIRQIQQITDVWFSYGTRHLAAGIADWLEQVIPWIAEDRLMFETDCQFGEVDDASDEKWPLALLRMAELRKQPVAELASILLGNTRRYFSRA
jgi:TatD DNase family protein